MKRIKQHEVSYYYIIKVLGHISPLSQVNYLQNVIHYSILIFPHLFFFLMKVVVESIDVQLGFTLKSSTGSRLPVQCLP